MTREQLLLALGRAVGPEALQLSADLVDYCIGALFDSSPQPCDKLWIVTKDTQNNSIRISLKGTDRTTTATLSEMLTLAEETDLLAARLIARAVFGIESEPKMGYSVLRVPRLLPDVTGRSPHGRLFSTTQVAEVLQRVDAATVVGLFGESSAGKTTIASQVSQQVRGRGWHVHWFDLSDPALQSLDLLVSLLGVKTTERLVILDDLQANPGAAREAAEILALCEQLQLPVRVLAIGWDSARRLAMELFPRISVHPVDGEQIIRDILAHPDNLAIKTRTRAEIRQFANGDVLVANHTLHFVATSHRLPTVAEVATEACRRLGLDETLDRDALDLLYYIACLSSFQIGVSVSAVQARSEAGLATLRTRRIVRLDTDHVTVGHSSLARLMLSEIERIWRWGVEALPAPAAVAVEYLQLSGDKQIFQTLEALDLTRLLNSGDDQHGATFLARAWQSVQVLVRLMEAQLRKDPTWGNNVTSLVFAALSLRTMRPELSRACEEQVWTRWSVSESDDLPVAIGAITSEREDWNQIKKRMEEEDEAYPSPELLHETAETIDFDRAHKTWLLGLLLVLEAQSVNPDPVRATRLKELAARLQEPEGFFYPRRIPWVTARVLLGLAANGDRVTNSRTVRFACEWLKKPVQQAGPYAYGVWEPGTGTWNSPLETTVMCLTALVRSGVSIDDPVIRSALSFSESTKESWLTPARELDAALCIELAVLVEHQWWEIRRELNALLDWTLSRSSWDFAAASADIAGTQSSKIPRVCLALINIVWHVVRQELPLLFEKYSITVRDEVETAGATSEHRLQEVLAACGLLREEIGLHVTDRLLAARSTPALGEGVMRWTRRKEELEQLLTRFRGAATKQDAVAFEVSENDLEHLGIEVMGDAWKSISRRPSQ